MSPRRNQTTTVDTPPTDSPGGHHHNMSGRKSQTGSGASVPRCVFLFPHRTWTVIRRPVSGTIGTNPLTSARLGIGARVSEASRFGT